MSRFDSVLGGGRRPQARTSTVGRPREDAFEDGERLACGVAGGGSHFLIICAVKAISGSTLHCVVRDRQRRCFLSCLSLCNVAASHSSSVSRWLD